jgi:5-methylcytosine-specific restriction endonuclease McrA
LKRVAEGSFAWERWEDLKKKYNYACALCGEKEPEIKLTIDHIVPISGGGTNWISNIQPLCRSCNSKKWKKLTVPLNNNVLEIKTKT